MKFLKNINWKVRINNPTWWAGVFTALLAPTLVYCGINFNDITSWKALWDIIVEAVGNPSLVVATLVSVYNACIDPTTAGVCDSNLAQTYERPKED